MTFMSTTVILPGWRGVDYSYSRPNPVGMANAGVTFVSRYLAALPNSKVILLPEVQALHAAGIGVILNWEQSAGDALKGGGLGKVHGFQAKTEATALGYPTVLPITVSVDTGVAPWALGLVESYLRAFAAAISPYPLGVYGGTDIIDLVSDICQLGWQANATSWSHDPPTNVHVRQLSQSADHQTDADIAVRPFQAWLPHDVPPPLIETSTPRPSPKESDMADIFTHSDPDHEGHPARFTFWRLLETGKKRHILEPELILCGDGRDERPAFTMEQIDQWPDYVEPDAVAVPAPVVVNAPTHFTGTIDLRGA